MQNDLYHIPSNLILNLVCAHMRVCVYVCACVHACVCMRVCACACVLIYVCCMCAFYDDSNSTSITAAAKHTKE